MIARQLAAVRRRRWFVAWVAVTAACAATLLADLLFQPLHVRVAGRSVSAGMTAVTYLSAAAMCLTALAWFRTAPKAMRRITPGELRGRAVRLSSDSRPGKGDEFAPATHAIR